MPNPVAWREYRGIQLALLMRKSNGETVNELKHNTITAHLRDTQLPPLTPLNEFDYQPQRTKFLPSARETK